MSHCPACDRPLVWGGMGWVEHTDAQHALLRIILLRAVAKQLKKGIGLRYWLDELSRRDEVGIRWHNGVFPHDLREYRTNIPRDAWELITPGTWAEVFRSQRAWMSRIAWEEHGVKVNPATWFHEVYE